MAACRPTVLSTSSPPPGERPAASSADERQARLRELERIVDAGEQDPTEAIVEIRSIRETAEAEAGL
ncbi:hypothetical protein [Streptomyces mirabilis]|uniref:hypothetical protein n=1 Tax=Streptomyces mirabilis TaxID=68239 RepID=UPI00380F5016